MEDLNRFVPQVTFAQIPIKNLVSNQNYQRNLSQSHINRAAQNFDLYQINPVKVSRRNGINYVFNGQHTIEIIALVSGSRDTPVWCMIYDDLNYEHEADIFANQQKFVKPLNPYEVFVANIEAGSDEQLIIQALVESYHLKISTKTDPGCICAVSTLEHIFEKYGYHNLDRTLRLCVGTWEGDRYSFTANVLNAISKMIATYGTSLNDEVFKEKLGAVSVKQVIRMAKERRAGSMGVAETMVILYNGKKKSPAFRLSLQKLYSNITIPEDEMDYQDENDVSESDEESVADLFSESDSLTFNPQPQGIEEDFPLLSDD